MRFHVLTIFPGMFVSPFAEGIIGRAQKQGLIEIRVHDIREKAQDRHRTVDDYPFGGGPGMVMKPGPLFEAVESVRASGSLDQDAPVVLLSPPGSHSHPVCGGGAGRAPGPVVDLRALRGRRRAGTAPRGDR